MTKDQLYQYAEEHHIDVDWRIMSTAESLSIQLTDGTCAVVMDPTMFTSNADETWKLSHELGHCETCSFYNRYSVLDERCRNEERADRWAIKHALPFEDLEAAIESGARELWELADILIFRSKW